MDQRLMGGLSRVTAGENKNNYTCLFNKSFKRVSSIRTSKSNFDLPFLIGRKKI